MTREPLVVIGTVRKTHGHRGEIRLAIEPVFREVAAKSRFLFIGEDAGRAVPYQVADRRGGEDIVALEGIDSKEAATALRGRAVMLRQSELGDVELPRSAAAIEEETAERFQKFVGFAVIDDEVGEVGAIAAVEAFPGQAMARVETESTEHLVPLTAELIKGVDFTKKIVFMRLPEGLLEL